MNGKKITAVLLISGSILIPSCKEDLKKMVVTTGTTSSVLTTTAVVSGTIIDIGEGANKYGHCYSSTANPTVAGTIKEMANPALGDFTSILSGLIPNTTYYVKAYLGRGNDIVYGSEINFKTASDSRPVLSTADVSSITESTAVSGGTITEQGGTPVFARGVCWSLASTPTIDLTTKTSDGPGTGSFTSSLTGLSSGKKYYVRAYATNAGGIAYGNEVSFTTNSDIPVVPTVTTAVVSSVTSSSAVCGGEVTNEGSASVTSRGVCWSTTANPTIINSSSTNGSGLGSFVSNLTGLDPGTKYYIRAYAINSAGTGYGTIDNFTTNAVLPTLTTLPVTSITAITANSGGDITNLGGSNISVKGVCWSLTSPATINDFKTTDGPASVTGTYVSLISSLSPNTLYYVKSYATNSSGGTGYGNELSFPTLASVTTSPISNTTSTTASSGGSIAPGGGANITARGVCWSTNPAPTIANNKTTDATGVGGFASSLTGLTSNTTYYVRAYATNGGGTAYGEQLSFTTLASIITSAISNITETIASSGGSIDIGGGENINARGICWGTSTNPTIANSKTTDGTGTGSFTSSLIGMTSNTTYYVRAYSTNGGGTAYGNQQSFTTLASLTTSAISNATATTASSGGAITAGGGASITARGVCWRTSTNPTIANSKTTNGTGTGNFTSSITGLTSNTTYYVRAYATNGGGTAYGNQQSFKTDPATLTDIDNNVYNLVRIGTQLWMQENLKTTKYKTGISIPLITDNTAWSNLTTSGYCWYNNDAPTYKDTYGALYNWYVVNTGNLCPTGFHLPSDAEWKILEMYLGMSQADADKTGYRGTDEGEKLKETGNAHWHDPTSGTNSSGLTALPGGYREYTGVFYSIEVRGYFWTATESSGAPWYRLLFNYSGYIFREQNSPLDGMSIRCVKD